MFETQTAPYPPSLDVAPGNWVQGGLNYQPRCPICQEEGREQALELTNLTSSPILLVST